MCASQKQVRTSDWSGSISSGIDIEQVHGTGYTDLELDDDLDWMLMADGQFLSENCEGGLYSLLPNSGILLPEHGS